MSTLHHLTAATRARRLTAAVALVAVVFTGLVADEVEGAVGEPLRVGVLVNTSGALSLGEGNGLEVIEAWADATNASGGVAGRSVEIVAADTKGDPSTGTAEAERLAGDDSIDALVLFDALTEGLYAEVIENSGLPVIGGMGFIPAWGTSPNWLPLTASTTSVFNMGMVLGQQLGATRTTLTICSEVPACAEAGDIAGAASEALGMPYAGTTLISSSAPDYTAECLKLRDDGVDYIMAGAASPAAAIRFIADCETQDYHPMWSVYGASVVPAEMIAFDPGVSIGVGLISFPWFADEEPVRAYRDMMATQEVPEEVWGDPHATAGYATLELFRKALENYAPSLPDTIGPADVIAAYGTIDGETLGGLLPQAVTFTPGEPQPLVSCYWFATFENGEFSWDGAIDEPVCDPPELS